MAARDRPAADPDPGSARRSPRSWLLRPADMPRFPSVSHLPPGPVSLRDPRVSRQADTDEPAAWERMAARDARRSRWIGGTGRTSSRRSTPELRRRGTGRAPIAVASRVLWAHANPASTSAPTGSRGRTTRPIPAGWSRGSDASATPREATCSQHVDWFNPQQPVPRRERPRSPLQVEDEHCRIYRRRLPRPLGCSPLPGIAAPADHNASSSRHAGPCL